MPRSLPARHNRQPPRPIRYCRDEWVGRARVMAQDGIFVVARRWCIGSFRSGGSLGGGIGRKGLDSTSPGLHAGRQDQARVNDMGRARAGL